MSPFDDDFDASSSGGPDGFDDQQGSAGRRGEPRMPRIKIRTFSTDAPLEDERGHVKRPFSRGGKSKGGVGKSGIGRGEGALAGQKLAKIKPTTLRIIGGDKRGRGVIYSGDRSTRPMKDSVRESLFNILNQSVKGTIAFDLFAGTGVLAMESLSRGATHAIAFEKSGLAAKTIRESADRIDIGEELEVLTGDTFRLAPAKMPQWARASGNVAPWVVFFCPPYEMWGSMTQPLFELIELTLSIAPAGSQLVAESDKFFDPTSLPGELWDIRRKGNVTLSFYEIE